MSAAKRKVYGAAFKGKVGLEAIRGLKTINGAPGDLQGVKGESPS